MTSPIRLFKLFVISGFVFALVIALLVTGYIYLHIIPRLPSTEALKNVEFQEPLRVYTRDGKLIGEFGEKRRTPIAYADTPDLLIKAVLAAEDDRFFQHAGVDYQGILRAIGMLVLTREKSQGGSTITMQVARNFFLSSEKTFSRKLNEIILSFRIEHELSKQEILELYLNKIFLGNRAYGFGAAAQVYYGKPLDQLSLAQIAMIAGLPKAPSRFNPIVNPTRALERRNYVLRRMHELGYITSADYDAAKQEIDDSRLHGTVVELDAPYVAEMARAETIRLYGEDAYINGVKVYTTIDSHLQAAANQAMLRSMLEYDQRRGYRGPLDHVEIDPETPGADWYQALARHPPSPGMNTALVIGFQGRDARLFLTDHGVMTLPWSTMRWARHYPKGKAAASAEQLFKVGDVIQVSQLQGKPALAQSPLIESAIVALAPRDGAIMALCGGYDFDKSKYNRAVQGNRQPGSSFKPFIYAAALERGYTPASIINDAPLVFEAADGQNAWRPENYTGEFYGPTRLREALAHSRNLVSIRLLQEIGISYATNYAARFGFEFSQMPQNLSLALGSGAATPLQLARGYAVFANSGYKVEPYLVQRIVESTGQVYYQANPAVACPECDIVIDSTNLLTDDSGNPIETTPPPTLPAGFTPPGHRAPRVITAQTSYQINSMLKDVIRYGTAASASSLGRQDLRGKTGTTNEQKDAWFSGYNESLVATVWVGFDKPTPLGSGETGSRLALPAWMYFMAQALKGVPEQPLIVPPNMVSVAFDRRTGKPTSADAPNAIHEMIPAEFAPSTEAVAPAVAEPENEPIPEDLF